jgi:hypothetical protein
MLGLLRQKREEKCYAKNRLRHPQHTQHTSNNEIKELCVHERSSFYREQKIAAQKAKM